MSKKKGMAQWAENAAIVVYFPCALNITGRDTTMGVRFGGGRS